MTENELIIVLAVYVAVITFVWSIIETVLHAVWLLKN